jgi:predicted small metal-binding protein
MKTIISCREVWFDCKYTVRGETKEEVMRNGMEHAKNAHNMKVEDIAAEMQQKIKRPIRSS